MVVKIWEAWKYVTVYDVLEWRDGAVFRTEFKGFAHRDRPRGQNEVYSSVSTSLTNPKTHPSGETTLEPWLG